MESNQNVYQNMGTDDIFLTRVMHPSECQEVFSIMEEDYGCWPFRKFKLYTEAFPSNVFVTVKKDTGEVVAAVSTFPTNPGEYFMGVLIVRPDFRLKGLASALLNDVIKNSTLQPATFVLLSKPGLDSMYSKVGFQATTPTFYVVAMTPDKDKLHKAISNNNTDNIKIVTYTPDMFESLNNYDTEFRGFDLRKYLSVETDSSSSFLVATSESSGRIVGYVAGVKTCTNLLIDGLYADDDGIAVQLFSELVGAFPDKTLMEFNTINPHGFLTQFCMEAPPPVATVYTRFATGNTAPMHMSKAYAIMDYTG